MKYINRAKESALSFDLASKYLHYNQDTGIITWRISPGKKIQAGSEAGTLGQCRRIFICFRYNIYSAHRLAWLLMTGSWSPCEVKHLNGVRNDNRWVNLTCPHA
jgi:hypothetical protein